MKFLKIFLSLIVIVIFSGCTISNKYDAYKGKVVDADTKQPIEGTSVLVVYMTEQYGLAGPVSHFADAQETLTDKNGEFKIPAIRINTFRIISGWERYPSVWIFKSQYGCFPRHKYATRQRSIIENDALVPDWSLPHKKYVTIELPRLRTKEERLENIGCRPVGVPERVMKQFTKTINIENISLGLQPYEEVKE